MKPSGLSACGKSWSDDTCRGTTQVTLEVIIQWLHIMSRTYSNEVYTVLYISLQVRMSIISHTVMHI